MPLLKPEYNAEVTELLEFSETHLSHQVAVCDGQNATQLEKSEDALTYLQAVTELAAKAYQQRYAEEYYIGRQIWWIINRNMATGKVIATSTSGLRSRVKVENEDTGSQYWLEDNWAHLSQTAADDHYNRIHSGGY